MIYLSHSPLDYYGHSLSEADIAACLGTASGFGTRWQNLRQLKSLGCSVSLEVGSFDALSDCLVEDLPPLLRVETSPLPDWTLEVRHAIVVVGLEGPHVYYHDPYFAKALQECEREQLRDAWSAGGWLMGVIFRP